MALSVNQIYWLAGLIEGEGCLLLVPSGYSKTKNKPSLQLEMTDEDVIQKVAALFNKKYLCTKRYTRPNSQPTYFVRVYGSEAVGWIYTLYSLLSLRRRAKAREIIGVWKGIIDPKEQQPTTRRRTLRLDPTFEEYMNSR